MSSAASTPSVPLSLSPTQLKSFSRHALARYREHFPDASPNQALAEAMLAHPIDATLAHTLAGRARAAFHSTQRPSDDLYRVSRDAQGVFILQRIRDEDAYFVRTYLRLGVQQQRIMRDWLEAQRPLHDAFIQGYLAAQNPDHTSLQQALQAHTEALNLLAARYRITPPNTRSTPTPPRPKPRPAPDAPDAVDHDLPSYDAPPHDTSGFLWSEAALKDHHTLSQNHPTTLFDLGRWLWLTPETVYTYVGLFPKSIVAQARWALIALNGRVIAFVTGTSAPQHVVRLLATASKLRQKLLRYGAAQAPSQPTPPYDRSRAQAALHHCYDPREVGFSHWEAEARAQARDAGLDPEDPDFLAQLDPVHPLQLPTLAFDAGLRLSALSHYAAWRSAHHVVLLRGHAPQSCAVVRVFQAPHREPLSDTADMLPVDALMWSVDARINAQNITSQQGLDHLDLASWFWLTPDMLRTLLDQASVSPKLLRDAAWGLLHPCAWMFALLVGDARSPRIIRVLDCPKKQRPAALLAALEHDRRPPPLRVTAPITDQATADVQAQDNTVADQATPEPSTVAHTLHEAGALKITRWQPQAMRQAAELGLPHIEAPYLDMLNPVPKAGLAGLLQRLKITPRAGHHYAARHYRNAVLIVRGQDSDAGEVVRCMIDPPHPDSEP